ncbi:hypothetical protein BDW02DRAFT_302039 [Decorospora gaudefroyi]|uniref:BTB domain-containing protein n=1 Tax=Decorospora gaudefroyi TaxID=184978 RepID=A0A6A5KGG9_9PLEO|nr:hypothetical protein BDW02DRAFT_302039 [Decorospora gaudefroyi]
MASTLTQGPVAVIKVHEHTYNIHKDLICACSAYFERALQIQNEDTLTLENVEPRVFERFVEWLYTGELPETWTNVDEMLGAVVFGHWYMAPLFHVEVHNVTVDYLVGKKVAPSDGCVDIALVFEELSEEHALRELLVELECLYGALILDESMFPGEFVRLVAASIEERGIGWEAELEACDFHVHGSAEEKWACVLEARDRI